jgi:hypothetical protein
MNYYLKPPCRFDSLKTVINEVRSSLRESKRARRGGLAIGVACASVILVSASVGGCDRDKRKPAISPTPTSRSSATSVTLPTVRELPLMATPQAVVERFFEAIQSSRAEDGVDEVFDLDALLDQIGGPDAASLPPVRRRSAKDDLRYFLSAAYRLPSSLAQLRSARLRILGSEIDAGDGNRAQVSFEIVLPESRKFGPPHTFLLRKRREGWRAVDERSGDGLTNFDEMGTTWRKFKVVSPNESLADFLDEVRISTERKVRAATRQSGRERR